MDDYNLVSREKMQGDTDAGPVVEHAEVHENHFGFSILAVQEDTQNGRRCLLDFEVEWSAIYFIAEPLEDFGNSKVFLRFCSELNYVRRLCAVKFLCQCF